MAKPSWFVDIKVAVADGSFKQPSWMTKADVKQPPGEYNPGSFEERKVFKASGAFDQGGFQKQEVEDLDPYGNYYFALQIEDAGAGESIEVAHFMECSGLKNSCTPYTIREGGQNAKEYKRPDRSKWENIVLKYATSASTYLLKWRDQWLSNPDNWKNRKNFTGAILLVANDGETVLKRYQFKNAWPVSWEGPAFNGDGSDLAIETLELAHDGLIIDREGTVNLE